MKQKTILCYGDSNTWGYIPSADHAAPKQRYARDKRWPGILQKLLGSNYYVVEEGLNSRTTNLDYALPPDRNGKTYLAPCLYSHAPIDLVILALGGNDLKTYFNRSPKQVKSGLSELVDIIQSSEYGSDLQSPPKVLITTPAKPMDFIESFLDEEGVLFLKGAISKSKELPGLFSQLAKEKSCYFLDTSEDVFPSGIDGVHYDEVAHHSMADRLAKKIKIIFPDNN